ncbi:MAG: desulfoferrodoxin FeS4 iron-binding domain-containing protein [Candidatus Bathyarchaeota archaeon]|nr:desulfoferrodoxin FeS4 iron-binding domain-containing protein [Candidatus Bathyarchaeota archaeon]MDG6222790.1 desulfoferrodoxin FeS4 iron-binding domain-containing protein [Candidatus Bathyarchaeum tardum]WGM89732.1 MAG: desulfoferrodoxin FeS4 iron-binding domain-containing protein [Candidatus Bathyarchaeum tardum]
MTIEGKMYACKVCDNVVKVMTPGKGILFCCDQPMQRVD